MIYRIKRTIWFQYYCDIRRIIGAALKVIYRWFGGYHTSNCPFYSIIHGQNIFYRTYVILYAIVHVSFDRELTWSINCRHILIQSFCLHFWIRRIVQWFGGHSIARGDCSNKKSPSLNELTGGFFHAERLLCWWPCNHQFSS